MTETRSTSAQHTPAKFDVVIAGGGMVGVALAASLAPSGLNIAVIEPRELSPEGYLPLVEQENAQGMDSRVSALTPVSEQILTSLGAWPYMQSLRVSPYRDMHVWDGAGTASIHFDAASVYRSLLGHIVENRVILAGLYQAASAFDNIRWINPATIQQVSNAALDSDGNWLRTLTLDSGEELTARLLVAADGARSKTRQLAGMTITEWDYQHHAVVTTVKTAKPHQQTAWQRFTEDGPLAFLPLPDTEEGEHQCSIVWSTSPENANTLLALNDNAFCQQLGAAFEYQLGDVLSADQRQVFPLVQRHAKQYVDASIALVGDAAHSIHPLAGQGVNLGFLDVATLAEEICHGAEQGVDFASPEWLRRYQRRRQGDVWKMMALMAGLKHLYGDVPLPIHWMRNIGLSQVDRLSPLKRLLTQQAMGFAGDLPNLAQTQ